mgnify:CR=1 FL=1
MRGESEEGRARVELLRSGTPEEIYVRISKGDPLDLATSVDRRLHELAYLIDPDALLRRTKALVVAAATPTTRRSSRSSPG